MASDLFHQIEPSLENYWRSIILFGRNVATYKFALAKALLKLRKNPNDAITLDELALPFAHQICQHLKRSPKQATSTSSKFLDSCRKFNSGELSEDKLRDVTVRLGFINVIDAFHIVNQGEISKRFYVDERNQGNKIRITDDFRRLCESAQFQNFEVETEARWRLVETAWEIGVSAHVIQVQYDDDQSSLYLIRTSTRIDITSCRESLNGYQKGWCFYCYRDIAVKPGTIDLADVDHFIPWILNRQIPQINGVWNLVLACRECNRGESGKFARVPSIVLLERLHKRNEYLISSHHPLRETIIAQTGSDPGKRASFLSKTRSDAKLILIHEWEPQAREVRIL